MPKESSNTNLSREDLHSHNLLAINFGGIGDEILFLPTLESIRKAYPDAKITLIVEPRSRSITEVTSLIDHIVCFDIKKRPLTVVDLLKLLSILRAGNYDLVVSSGSSWMVAVLLFLSSIKKRVGYSKGNLSAKLLTNPVRLNQDQYAANMYHDLVTGLGLPQKDVVPKIEVRADHLEAMKKLIGYGTAKSGIRRILIHPGTSRLSITKGIIKTWPTENWLQLIKNLLTLDNVQLILAGGPDDEKTVNQILQGLPSSTNILSTFGLTKSLADLAALTCLSDLLVCVDSAPMHIAVGLNKPIVAMFGPTDSKKLLPQSPDFQKQTKVLKSLASHDVSGVQLPPESVFQSVLDLLQVVKVQGKLQKG